MRRANLWTVLIGLLLVGLFVGLDRTPAQASFTLVGLVSCNAPTGTICPIGRTLTLLSDDSGTKQLYTIDLG